MPRCHDLQSQLFFFFLQRRSLRKIKNKRGGDKQKTDTKIKRAKTAGWAELREPRALVNLKDTNFISIPHWSIWRGSQIARPIHCARFLAYTESLIPSLELESETETTAETETLTARRLLLVAQFEFGLLSGRVSREFPWRMIDRLLSYKFRNSEPFSPC